MSYLGNLFLILKGDYMSKPKKRVGRPTKVEAVVKKMEEAIFAMDERIAEELPNLFNKLMDITGDSTQPGATRAAACKYLIERAEKFIESNQDSSDSDVTDYDFTKPLIRPMTLKVVGQ